MSGDAVVTRDIGGTLLVALIDVLGHGPEAHELAIRIQAFVESYGDADLPGLMTRLHAHVRGSRGAAIGLGAFDVNRLRLDYVGVGNTVVRRFGRTESRLVSHGGVLGQNMRTPHVQSLALEPADLVVFYTDGIRDRFSTQAYPGLFHHAPDRVVRNLIERFGKSHDDAGCVAVRCSATAGKPGPDRPPPPD